jgi:glycosyltransferase involved in cell wall biosynthesis
MKNKLLQISNDFADQKIYVNLVKRLSAKGFEQMVYVPVRWQEKINGNRDDSIKGVTYHYSYILKRNLLFKLRFYRKIRIILNDLERKIDLSEVGLVHAHFLFSDGAIAYRLKQKYNIPYVVSVRATDIHTFFPYMVHLRKLGNRIINEAEKVIFINYSYKHLFDQKYRMSFLKETGDKFLVIPNAIDDAWFKKSPPHKDIQDPIHLLYVGRVIKRKKLDIVIRALKKLNAENNSSFRLEVVGEGDYLKKVRELADDNVIFHGRISDTDQLLKIYERCHIFTMPALRETFGLVYIEALSQGLPIIYCRGEGVDGYFKEESVGYAASPNSVSEVVDGIHIILKDYGRLSANAINESKSFNWDDITNKYVEVYQASFSQT